MAIFFTLALLGIVAGADPVANPPSQCRPEKILRRLERQARDAHGRDTRTQLILGIASGMTRREVRAVDRRLTFENPNGSYRLIDGFDLYATTDFDPASSLAVAVKFKGSDRFRDLIAALDDRYGTARDLGEEVTFPTASNGPGYAPASSSVNFKWCDGPREFLLSGSADAFTVRVVAVPG